MTSQYSAVEPRPTSVTVAVAIGWVSVALDLMAGVGLLVLSNNDSVLGALDATSGTVVTAGITTLVMGAILAIVVYMLSGGSSVARMLVSIVMVVRIGFAVWVLIAFGSHQFAEALVTIGVAAFALALLWNEKANAFFGSTTSGTVR
jgi:hypothetical protein